MKSSSRHFSSGIDKRVALDAHVGERLLLSATPRHLPRHVLEDADLARRQVGALEQGAPLAEVALGLPSGKGLDGAQALAEKQEHPLLLVVGRGRGGLPRTSGGPEDLVRRNHRRRGRG